MVSQVVFKEIMGWKMLMLRDLWLKHEGMEGVLTFGAGTMDSIL
jgi:hypothetical protein